MLLGKVSFLAQIIGGCHRRIIGFLRFATRFLATLNTRNTNLRQIETITQLL